MNDNNELRLHRRIAENGQQEVLAWNRCDVCGKFIAIDDFSNGAMRQFMTPDSEFSKETYQTFCIKHAKELKT